MRITKFIEEIVFLSRVPWEWYVRCRSYGTRNKNRAISLNIWLLRSRIWSSLNYAQSSGNSQGGL
jgi:hypothetical protein